MAPSSLGASSQFLFRAVDLDASDDDLSPALSSLPLLTEDVDFSALPGISQARGCGQVSAGSIGPWRPDEAVMAEIQRATFNGRALALRREQDNLRGVGSLGLRPKQPRAKQARSNICGRDRAGADSFSRLAGPARRIAASPLFRRSDAPID